MNNLMVDIETLGTKNTSIILSIGACYFDINTGEIGPTFHQHISAESCADAGLTADMSTVMWWLGQNKDAQNALIEGSRTARPLHEVLQGFSAMVGPGVKVWGNGATFDNTIIKNAYDRIGMKVPWDFWNDRDVRTIVDLGQQVGIDPKRDMPFQGVKHDALADAVHQARYVSYIWQRLTSAGATV
ncbi:ribonuclease H-like domain protein [Vibrio phage 1.009.O._10N.261.51.C9]|nr:ribonuclease H-like domain protein [Vibrio phage 1.009.O._10N.261.51.C9]